MTEIQLQRGDQLRQYFLPDPDSGIETRIPTPEVDQMVEGTRRGLRSLRRDLVTNSHGRFSIAEESADAFKQAGLAIANLLQQESIVTPNLKIERQALGRVLVESAVEHNGEILCIAPVCPDYSDSRMSLGGDISAEAEAGIRGMRAAIDSLSAAGFKPRGMILIADTEDDLQDVMQRSVAGERERYFAQCQSSVTAVKDELGDTEAMDVMTFSTYFGAAFRTKQYFYEQEIREAMVRSASFRIKIEKIGIARKNRHSQILGRAESDYELTIRYAAQYMALGDLLRANTTPSIVLNYETPNRVYINPHRADVVFPETTIIPVFGTKVRRKK